MLVITCLKNLLFDAFIEETQIQEGANYVCFYAYSANHSPEPMFKTGIKRFFYFKNALNVFLIFQEQKQEFEIFNHVSIFPYRQSSFLFKPHKFSDTI